MDGIATARELKQILPFVQIIFHTGFAGEHNEAEIDRTEHPFDFIVKGRSVSEVTRAVKMAFEKWQLHTGNLWRQAKLDFEMIGTSNQMQKVYQDIYRLAQTDARVLILGESGTGKELVARGLHRMSARRNAPFALVSFYGESLDQVSASLFGALAGSYSGLNYNRTGTMEYASDGVILIDEIGDLPTDIQVRLLRVVEYGQYQRYGSPETCTTNARFLFATNCDLDSLVKEGKFRHDFFYRLGAITITLPPLRHREEDIVPLADYFLDQHTVAKGRPVRVLENSARDVLLQYDWPGNVRQLNSVIEAAAYYDHTELIGPDEIVRAMQAYDESKHRPLGSLEEMMAACERNLIIRALLQAGGKVTDAAALLQIDRSSLHRKIKQHNIDRSGLNDAD